MISVSAQAVAFPPPSLLVLESDADARHEYMKVLGRQFAIMAVESFEGAVAYLARTSAAVVVTELVLPDGDGIEVCRAAKSLEKAPAVLITTADVDRVPDALEAGCDSVLVKPFAPNLLSARLGRLACERSDMLRRRVNGTNQFCPDMPCPHCGHVGVVSFDYAAYRRAWYACLACKKVWTAARAAKW